VGFELVVVDVFKLGDGRTLFSCEAVSAPPFIRPCACTLHIDGKPISVVHIDGEDLPHPNRTGLRVVSTRASVAIDRTKLEGKAYRLVCRDDT